MSTLANLTGFIGVSEGGTSVGVIELKVSLVDVFRVSHCELFWGIREKGTGQGIYGNGERPDSTRAAGLEGAQAAICMPRRGPTIDCSVTVVQLQHGIQTVLCTSSRNHGSMQVY